MSFDPASVERLLASTAGIRWRLRLLESVPSTMDAANALAAAGEPEGTVVVAEEQTAGRGRMGRAWVSPKGLNLYFTVILRPTAAVLRRMAIIAPLAVAEGIERATGLHAEIKWPNDIQLRGLKCSGVLIDSQMRGPQDVSALLGIGIDVNQDVTRVPDLRNIATSLAAEVGRPLSREALLASVLESLGDLYVLAGRGGDVRAGWRARLNTLGRSVRVSGPGTAEAGVAVDVDDDGSLVLRRDDGSVVVLPAGEVSLRSDGAAPVEQKHR